MKHSMKQRIPISSLVVDALATGSGLSLKDQKTALKKLSLLGFKPRLRGAVSSGFFAQDEKKCFRHLKKSLEARDSQIIWCLRGGYGAGRLLPFLDDLKKPPSPKLFIGHSDSTVIHNYLGRKWGWPSLHFPVLSQLKSLKPSSLKEFSSLFFKEKKYQIFSNLKILNPGFKKKRASQMTSQIVGGNLTMMQSLIAGPWGLKPKNQILFLEDNANEKPHSIDRSLWQMEQSGMFQNLKALLFGIFEKDNKQIIEAVLTPFAKKWDFPVLVNLPCGHCAKSRPLPLYSKTRLHLKNKKAILEINNPIFFQ